MPAVTRKVEIPTQPFTSVFAAQKEASYPFHFSGQLHVSTIVGGVPRDPKVAEGWLRSKLGDDKDQQIRDLVAEIALEQEISFEAALEEVNKRKNLNGFRRERCPNCPSTGLCGGEHLLYIEGRQLKAALKEAVSVACAAKKINIKGWGETRKFLTNYFPEHCFIIQERLTLGVTEPSGVFQHFVHSRFGSSISYQEYVEGAVIDFNVITDHDFSDKEWGLIWTTGEMQGIGASRSQEYGRYAVTRWERTK